MSVEVKLGELTEAVKNCSAGIADIKASNRQQWQQINNNRNDLSRLKGELRGVKAVAATLATAITFALNGVVLWIRK